MKRFLFSSEIKLFSWVADEIYLGWSFQCLSIILFLICMYDRIFPPRIRVSYLFDPSDLLSWNQLRFPAEKSCYSGCLYKRVLKGLTRFSRSDNTSEFCERICSLPGSRTFQYPDSGIFHDEVSTR